jgi:hypothetical protein
MNEVSAAIACALITIRQFRQLCLLGGAFLLTFAGPIARSARGDTILSNPVISGQIDDLGEHPPNIGVADDYFAQSFTTPTDNTAVSDVAFYIRNSTDSPSFGVNTNGPVNFRLLLTSVVHDATGIRPNQVLFESAPVSIPYVPPTPVPPFSFIQVAVPDVQLSPATEYAYVLDAATDENLTDNVAARAAVLRGVGYDGGQFFSYRVPWEQTGGVIGPRSTHFAADWAEFPAADNVDMAFKITFVPEPTGYVLMGIGSAGVFLVGIRSHSERRLIMCRAYRPLKV